MKKLLGYAEPGDTLVVWRVDRLGRSLVDVLNTVNLLQDRGVALRSVSDGIDPATNKGRLMLNMLATLADYERELITERVNARIAAGPWWTRQLSPASLQGIQQAIALQGRTPMIEAEAKTSVPGARGKVVPPAHIRRLGF
jgi:hypothetical protein